MSQEQNPYVDQLKCVWSHSIFLPRVWLPQEPPYNRSFEKYLYATKDAIEFLDEPRLRESMNHLVEPEFFGLAGAAPDAFTPIETISNMTLRRSSVTFSTTSIRQHMDGAKCIREFFYGIMPSCYLQRNPVVRTYDSDGAPRTTQSELDFAVIYQQFGHLNFAMKYAEGGITKEFLDHYGNYYRRCVSRDKALAISPSHPALLLATAPESGSVNSALQHLRKYATMAVLSMVSAWNSHSRDSSLPPWAVIFGFVCNPDAQNIGLYAYLPTLSASPSGVASREVHVDEFPFRSYPHAPRPGLPVREQNKPIFLERLRFSIALLALRKHIIWLSSIWDSSTLPPDIQRIEDELGKAYSLYRPTPSPSEISSGDPFEEQIKWYFDVCFPKAIPSENSEQSEYEDPVDGELDGEAQAELSALVERWRQDIVIEDIAALGDVPEHTCPAEIFDR